MRQIAVCSLLCALAIGLAWMSSASQAQQVVAPAEPGIRFDGFVLPSRQLTMNAPVDSVLESVLVEEGQRVKKGEHIAQMDAKMQQLAVAAARIRATSDAEILFAQFQLEEAQIMYDRSLETFEANAASEWEVRRSKLQRDQAKVRVDSAKEQKTLAAEELKLEEERLARFRIEAPFDGLVLRVQAEPGATLTRDDPVLHVVKMSPLEAEIHLPTRYFNRLVAGRAYTLDAGAPVDTTLKATLKQADEVFDPASQTFRAVFEIDNAEGKLPAGFTVWLAASELAGAADAAGD